MRNENFTVGDPVLSYRETVKVLSHQTCLSKAPNKHNRIYLQAGPMSDELCTEIEDGKVGPKADPKERARLLHEKFGHSEADASKIWAWSPETEGANPRKAANTFLLGVVIFTSGLA
jgi:elongation factor 2